MAIKLTKKEIIFVGSAGKTEFIHTLARMFFRSLPTETVDNISYFPLKIYLS